MSSSPKSQQRWSRISNSVSQTQEQSGSFISFLSHRNTDGRCSWRGGIDNVVVLDSLEDSSPTAETNWNKACCILAYIHQNYDVPMRVFTCLPASHRRQHHCLPAQMSNIPTVSEILVCWLRKDSNAWLTGSLESDGEKTGQLWKNGFSRMEGWWLMRSKFPR